MICIKIKTNEASPAGEVLDRTSYLSSFTWVLRGGLYKLNSSVVFYWSAFRRVAINKHQPNVPSGDLQFVPSDYQICAWETKPAQSRLSANIFIPLQVKNNRQRSVLCRDYCSEILNNRLKKMPSTNSSCGMSEINLE